MAFTDIFKGNQYKKELDELKALMTPEHEQALDIQRRIQDLIAEEEKRQRNVDRLNEESARLKKEIEEKTEQIVWMDEEIQVQEFGLYTTTYEFANSTQYKERLAEVRSDQKALIKADDAVDGDANWTVNGSAAQGRKMVNDTKKLLLRAFNSECDGLISKVKYTNYDTYKGRIMKSSEIVSRLGKVMGISITPSYLYSKLEELRLAFEYQQKKQEEKEAQKEARAELREAARLKKEIEAQRKKIKKEQTHYQTELEHVRKQLEVSPDDLDLLKKKNDLEQELGEIDKAIKDVDYRQANQRAGYVYVISNIGSFGPDVYKIGMTRRLDPQDRVDELGDASVPFKFDVHAMIFSDDAPALEAALHRAFEDRKVNMVNTRREFFNVTLDEIKEVIKRNFDKTVDFVDVPDAEQYRVSKKMKESN